MSRSQAVAAVLLTLAMHGLAHAEKIVRPVGPEVVVVEGSYDLVDDYELGVAGDDFGNFVIVWDGHDQQVHGVRLSADNVPMAPFDLGGDPLRYNFLPRIAMQASGAFVVAWGSAPGVTDPATIVARLFDSTTAPQSDVFPLDGVAIVPSVAMDTAGNFVAAWEAFDGHQDDVAARRFDATGTPIGDVFQVNAEAPGNQVSPAVVADDTGGFVVAWRDIPGSADGALIEARRFDASGTAVGGDVPVSQSASNDLLPAVGADAAGDFVVAWLSHYKENSYGSAVVARRFDATATPRAAEEKLAKRVWYTGREAPRVAVDPSGEFVVVWGSRYDEGTVFARASAGGGLSATFHANQTDEGSYPNVFPAVATGGSGDFLVVWFDADRGLVARRLGPRRTTTKLRIADDGDPSQRKLTIKPVGAVASSGLGRRIDPPSDGAFLHVYNASGAGTDSACISLPAARWQAKGADASGATRFVYRDPAYADGPCASITVANRKVVKASCRATAHPIDFTLDEAQQGSVVVRLVSGERAYCSAFGPDVAIDEPGRFAAANAVPAGECPAAPAACP